MATIDIKLKSYDELTFEITKLNTDIYLKDKEIERLKEVIQENDKEIDNLCKNQKKEIERLNKKIEDIDDIIKNHYIVGHKIQNDSLDSILKDIKELKEGKE